MRAQQAPTFSQIVVFGDSLSDDGNIRHKTEEKFGVSYPGGDFNYSDGRFTNSSDTDPASQMFVGTWHEQLADTFLSLPIATNSLDGGFDYAFGGATTEDSTSDRTVISNPDPFFGGDLEIEVQNAGRQINQYLGDFTPDPDALYVIWGGGNDLFDDDSAESVTATAGRVGGLVVRLATAGARNILVPNVPPLGAVPLYHGDSEKVASLDLASSDYRTELDAELDAAVSALATQGITIQLYRVDIWSLFLRLTAEPSIDDFTNVTESAQGNSSANPDQYLFWDDIHPTTAAHFQIAQEANRVLSGEANPPGRAVNLSTRGAVGTGENSLIGGFIITGTDSKKVILRAIGPSLASDGVMGALADPTMSLFDTDGALVATNDDWKDTQQAEIEATMVPPTNDRESAIVQTLAPGDYTLVVTGVNGGTGVALVEAYDLDDAAASTLRNVSTRGLVGTGEDVLIGGFIVGAGDDPIVMVRAIGPSLTAAGVMGALQDPTLELRDENGTLLASNDDWKETQATAIKATLLEPTDDRESALVSALPAGPYTTVVRGKAASTGVALVEVYRVQ